MTEKVALNQTLEEIMALVEEICSVILREFREAPEKVGIKPSPLKDPDVIFKTYSNQEDRFKDNILMFPEQLNFYRDCLDCYFVMARQKRRKPLSDETCLLTIQYIQKARYKIGTFLESMKVLETNMDSKRKWLEEEKKIKQLELEAIKSSLLNRTPSINGIRLQERLEKELDALASKSEEVGTLAPRWKKNKPPDDAVGEARYRANLLNSLLQKKFNFKNSFLTRESKVQLKEDQEEIKLALIKDMKNLMKNKPVADNRMLVLYEKLTNPFHDKEIRHALKVAKEFSETPLDVDLLDIAEYEDPKKEGEKKKEKKLIKLSDQIRNLLSEPKVKWNTLAISEEEAKYILEKLDKDPTSSSKVLSAMVQTKPHVTCVVDKEVLQSFKIPDRRDRKKLSPVQRRNFNRSIG